MKGNSRKLISIIKISLDVAWYGNFILALVASIFLSLSTVNDYDEASSYIRTPSYIFKKDIAGKNDDVKNALLRTNIAYLSYEIRSTPFVRFSGFFSLIAIEALIFSIIYHLRKLFSSLNKGLAFTQQNVATLKRISLLILLILPVQFVFFLAERYFFEGNFPTSYQFSVEPQIDFKVIIIAAILYIAAEIFNYGLELKKETEEFI